MTGMATTPKQGQRAALATAALAALVACVPQGQALSADAAALVPACVQPSPSFAARKAAISALGYRPIKGVSDMWVQAQVAHIAISDLEYDGTRASIKATYDDYLKSAQSGDLFRTDTDTQHFTDTGKTLEISLAVVDGEPSCSIAFAPGTKPWPVPGRTDVRKTADVGLYETYAGSGGVDGGRSVLSQVWDAWMAGGRKASGFLILGVD
ncbi:hypothetical protein [Actibacterium sp. 188UL27-1]|uniref:hypothetical protein n=1 Tax=Actibacterium sp. 188UL27-1 TaxID=2786961 RepID=UPI0019583296|nr:hypothetical protein [Actibacterium sp. 188UL27-1]MBM7068357.1 hypothetical protein [Actibacterium sp. 188UL27-1]